MHVIELSEALSIIKFVGKWIVKWYLNSKYLITLGKTSAPLYNPDVQGKIPETLFYDTPQNLAVMEAMLQDFLMGEHLLLIGNQVSLESRNFLNGNIMSTSTIWLVIKNT